MANTQTLTKTKINNLTQEVKFLRSAVIGWIGKDSEGGYNPEFVKSILKNCADKNIYSFKDKKSFLGLLK